MVIKANFKTLVSLLFVVGVGLENNNNNINKRNTTRKMPFSDEEFLTDPKSPLKKSYFRWQNKALANTW